MKINLFYILIGTVILAGGWGIYHFYFQKPAVVLVPPAATQMASIGISSGLLGDSTTSLPMSVSTSSAAASTSRMTSEAFMASTTPAGIPAPTAPTGLSAITITDNTIVLSWGTSYDPTGVAGYKIFMNGKETGTAAAQKLEIPNLQASTTYTFTVSAYNEKGETSPSSMSLKVTTKPPRPIIAASSTVTSTSSSPSSTDQTPPSVPGGLTVTGVSPSEIDLSWRASTDNVGVAGYRIFSNNVFIATTSGIFYRSTGLIAGADYSYAVAAYDAAGNVSAQAPSMSAATFASNSALAQTSNTDSNSNTPPADTTPPTTNISSPAANATLAGVITISASASDDVGVVKVRLYVDSSLAGTDTALPYVFSFDTATLADGSHVLTTKAYDAAGNIGTSAAVSITTDNTPATNSTTTNTTANATTTATTPPAPTGLSAIVVPPSEIDLTWTALATSTGITGYQIFRNGHPLSLSAGVSTIYHDSGLAASTTYAYTIAAYIGTPGNEGPQSGGVSATTP